MPLILVRLPVVEEHWQESLLMVKLLLERCHICLSSVIRHLAWFLKVSEGPHNHIKQLPQHVWMCHPVVLSCLHPACRHSPFFIPLYSLSLPQTFLGSIRADLASEGWERGGLKVFVHSMFLIIPTLVSAAAPHFSWSPWNCQSTCRNLSHCLLMSQNSQF